MEIEPTMENIRLVDNECLTFSDWLKALKLEDDGIIDRPNKVLFDLYHSYKKFNRTRLARHVRRLRFYKYSNSEIYDKLNKKR